MYLVIRLIRLVSKSTTASSPSQLSTLHSRRRRRQAALTSQVDASTVYSTPPANATSSHSVLRNRTTVSPLNTAISFSNETQFNNDDTTAPSFNNTTTTSTTAEPTQGRTNSVLLWCVSIQVSCYGFNYICLTSFHGNRVTALMLLIFYI